MKLIFSTILVLNLLLPLGVSSQTNCKTIDINKVPGQWVWDKRGGGDVPVTTSQWQLCNPIRKELQRIMPVPLDGLHATNSIAFGNMPAVPNTQTAPKYYECYLMLKKYECLTGYNILQPEGETGCWVYFVMNSIFQGSACFQDGLHFVYYQNEGGLFVGDYYIEKDASAGCDEGAEPVEQIVVVHGCKRKGPSEEGPFRRCTGELISPCWRGRHRP